MLELINAFVFCLLFMWSLVLLVEPHEDDDDDWPDFV